MVWYYEQALIKCSCGQHMKVLTSLGYDDYWHVKYLLVDDLWCEVMCIDHKHKYIGIMYSFQYLEIASLLYLHGSLLYNETDPDRSPIYNV